MSFYVGYLEGRRKVSSGGVTLSCSDSVLEALKIPTNTLASQLPQTKNLTAGVAEVTIPTVQVPTNSTNTSGKYLGSKNGTKYYTPQCSGVRRIKPENIIWFQSEQDAQLQGYTAAKC